MGNNNSWVWFPIHTMASVGRSMSHERDAIFSSSLVDKICGIVALIVGSTSASYSSVWLDETSINDDSFEGVGMTNPSQSWAYKHTSNNKEYITTL